GVVLLQGLANPNAFDLPTEIACVAALVFCCAHYLLSLPYRIGRSRCKSLSKKFAKAYKKAFATEPTRFADLPVMPVWTPYDTETTVMSTSIPTNDVDAFLDAFVAEFYETTGGDVALTRGDNHKAATGKARVVLALKETVKRGELAVVALTVKPVGRVANVSIRWSCWPASIWPGRGAGLWSVVAQKILGDSWRRTMVIRYFKPRNWIFGEEIASDSSGSRKIVAEFSEETEAEAQDLARLTNTVLSQMTATGSRGF
ncbi:MAG: hypothetical protein IKW13_05115, partial [Thermoguttaceae bacterium]|nr:hypothetical protein [Thermoguttaceae bacterium]